jgi:hypothetical protein
MPRTIACAAAVLFVCVRGAAAQCGGTERWPVKVGADPDGNLVNLTAPIPTASLHQRRGFRRQFHSLSTTSTTNTMQNTTVRTNAFRTMTGHGFRETWHKVRRISGV